MKHKTACILLVVVAVLAKSIGKTECFIPAELFTFVIEKAGSKVIDYGQVSETIVHEEIARRGAIASITNYLIDQKKNGSRVSRANLTAYQDDLKKLYYDYYGVWLCKSKLNTNLETDLQLNVAVVDLDPSTKDLPYAHFDAETFIPSNQRVIDMRAQISTALANADYEKARDLSGKVLHTIQDFYSHSNWIEMGNTDFNRDIGLAAFATKYQVATAADNVTCIQNCTLVNVTCSSFISALNSFLQFINFKSIKIPCPTPYFICTGNLVSLGKLVSGYYGGQKLSDGTDYLKPNASGKCSHGGILDADQFKSSAGGINKDSGYYLFSPHADLHLMAAKMAINHTEYFFDMIRKEIGDDKFNTFFSITVDARDVAAAKNVTYEKCAAHLLAPTLPTAVLALIFSQFIFFYIYSL